MSRTPRVFEDVPAIRDRVPLLVGIDGCSSAGKTWSALRLATGMQRVYGGDIRLIDADHGRGKHYADVFRYRRVPFDPPFGSLDFLDAIQGQIAKGGIVIVDHMSAEHDGEGGLLDTQEEAKKGKESRNAVAWKIAKGFHHQLVRAIQQIGTPVILLWRAADKLDWKTGGEPKKLGMMPIGSKDIIFEMTVNIYLPPAARGVPNWTPTEVGERMMTKLPEQFRGLFRDGEPLCEEHGEAMARWAMGSAAPSRFEALRDAIGQADARSLEMLIPSLREAKERKTVSAAEHAALQKAYASRRDELASAKPPSSPPGPDAPTVPAVPTTLRKPAGKAPTAERIAATAVRQELPLEVVRVIARDMEHGDERAIVAALARDGHDLDETHVGAVIAALRAP